MSITKAESALKFQSLITFAFDRLLEQSMALGVLRKIIEVKVALDPEFIIKEAGPFFFKYRKYIDGGDLKFFLNHDYKEQLLDLNDLTAGYGAGIASGFIENIKTSLDKAKPEIVKKLISSILKTYCEYVVECKKETK